jgi:hypothetical protein
LKLKEILHKCIRYPSELKYIEQIPR